MRPASVTFDPKTNQFIFIPRCTMDKNSSNDTTDIAGTSLMVGRTDS